jgi:ribonucleoside-diphosphate reductase alpha chain
MSQRSVCVSTVDHPSLKLQEERDSLITDFGKKTLENRYLLKSETYQGLFMRVARAYSDDDDHAARMYDYISRHWFMPATPVLSNGGTKRGLPISCFLNESEDSLDSIAELWNENVWLAAKGGGIGSYWGGVRSIGESIHLSGETSGVIPFIKVMDSLTLAISQGSLRRGSGAAYLPIHHPEIEEFLGIRKPTGGDHNRKTLNLHHGVVITDAFMQAVEKDDSFPLVSPADGHAVREISARYLWSHILTTRVETGEPYILYIDHVNRALPKPLQDLGLTVKTSNLCSEITLPTGPDTFGGFRTAVCCLSSLNLESYLEWSQNNQIIEDCLRFLDNVLEDFIQRAPSQMHRAIYSAKRERSVGLGVMGFHSFLQAQNTPFEGVMAKVWNKKIFQHIRAGADKASKKLAAERGACPDMQACGREERFTNKLAIAPTASISIICGGVSPGIEPFVSNAYTHKTLNGSFPVRNKHLTNLLIRKGQNTSDVWTSINQNEGSVQHLDFLNVHEKAVFKTAFELDQRVVVDLAADRQAYICQSQSLNIFVSSNIHKRDLHTIHWEGWKKGVKSFYYTRSKTLQRGENCVSANKHQNTIHGKDQPTLPIRSEECLSCQ